MGSSRSQDLEGMDPSKSQSTSSQHYQVARLYKAYDGRFCTQTCELPKSWIMGSQTLGKENSTSQTSETGK